VNVLCGQVRGRTRVLAAQVRGHMAALDARDLPTAGPRRRPRPCRGSSTSSRS